MLINKKLTIIITLLQVIFPDSVFGGEDISKSYFVKSIDVVCDYPFNDTTKWAITCRVWGILKYFHPNVNAGKFDWDQVLIDMIGKIREARTTEQVNTELMKMIQIAGEYSHSKDTARNDSLYMNVNLCWLDHSFINDTIRQALREIVSLTIEQPSHYIKPHEDRDYLAIPNEKDFDKDVIFQYEYRLLALFRYWNVIYYFFPYKYLMDQSWDETLTEFIPQFMLKHDFASYHKVVNKIVTRLNDGHAGTLPSLLQYDIFEHKSIILLDSTTIVRTPPKGSFLEKGDIILSLDEKNIWSVRDSISALIGSSNKLFTDNGVNSWIHYFILAGGKLTVLRNEQMVTIIEYEKPYPRISDLTSYRTLSPGIGYVNLELLKSSDIPNMIGSMKDYKGIIFDLRNYPRYFKEWDILSCLSSTQEYCYALATQVDILHCGAFYKYECNTKCPDELWYERKKINGKIIVLINSMTFSWAETLTMMFKIHGATLVGTPTAGTNGDVVILSLPGGIVTAYSGIGFYFPDGTQTQRTGIIPDIEVYPTMDDVMAGRDEVLEAAIKYLKSN